MPDPPPLREAAILAGAQLEQAWRYDGWPALSHLYAGALLQLRFETPKGRELVRSFSEMGLHCEASRPYLARDQLQAVLAEILACENSARLSRLARDVISHLGPLVFSKVSFLLTSDQELARGDQTSPCISGSVGGTPFQLVPAFHGGGSAFQEEPLKHRLMSRYPEDGFDGQRGKILPRYVRLVSGKSLARSKVLYLETLDPQANRRLAEHYQTRGLVLAALPLHPRVRMSMNRIERTEQTTIFRLQEPGPEDWPKGWENHLQASLEECENHQAAIAVLPELLGSPLVRAVCEQTVTKKRMNFPILLAAGSWHEDEGEVFRNRLRVYTCAGEDGLREICVHDKFAHLEYKEHVEGHEPGVGFTYLVTSVGILALGICRDWFFDAQPAGAPEHKEAISNLVPTLCIAPSMTTHVSDLNHGVTHFFRRERSLFLFSNACGPVRHMRKKKCCADGGEDLRSFVAAPTEWYDLETLNHAEIEDLERGKRVAVVKGTCRSQESGDNTALARVRLREE